MSDYYIYLKMPPYLAQWFVNVHGGNEPVKLLRGSIESKFLRIYLERRPEGAIPQRQTEGEIAIEIPYFRTKPPQTYNYLSPTARRAILGIIRDNFDLEFWEDNHVFGKIGKKKEDIIYAWMEKKGIEKTATNWDAISKRYKRLREEYMHKERSKSAYEKSKKK